MRQTRAVIPAAKPDEWPFDSWLISVAFAFGQKHVLDACGSKQQPISEKLGQKRSNEVNWSLTQTKPFIHRVTIIKSSAVIEDFCRKATFKFLLLFTNGIMCTKNERFSRVSMKISTLNQRWWRMLETNGDECVKSPTSPIWMKLDLDL